jgi:two-component system response regulator PilR (NtrC family)
MPVDPTGSYHVLVADDDADVRDLFAEFLRERGYIVSSVQDGRAAVAELERSNGVYGVVFTDLSMPGADGFKVLRAARAANPSAYIVIVTGYASIDTAIQAVREGANDYLAKPCSLGQIEIALQRARSHATLSLSASVVDRLAGVEERLQAIADGLARIEQQLTARQPPG